MPGYATSLNPITGSAFEHIPFMWASFLEISRVLRPGGLIFLTAPSRGHIHFDMDCWRFYPDSMRALAAFSRMNLLEAHTDMPPKHPRGGVDYALVDYDRNYWGDTVGVFRKPRHYSRQCAPSARSSSGGPTGSTASTVFRASTAPRNASALRCEDPVATRTAMGLPSGLSGG